jgi:hypothetical protein
MKLLLLFLKYSSNSFSSLSSARPAVMITDNMIIPNKPPRMKPRMKPNVAALI